MHGCAQKVVENTVEKKATKRALQAQRTKENIYRCGVKLFREYGFEAVTVEQLAKAAGVGIGTFYHYYPSKMALYTKLFIHAEDYFEEFETGQALQGSAYDVLQQYFKKYAALNAEPGQEFAQVLVTREAILKRSWRPCWPIISRKGS